MQRRAKSSSLPAPELPCGEPAGTPQWPWPAAYAGDKQRLDFLESQMQTRGMLHLGFNDNTGFYRVMGAGICGGRVGGATLREALDEAIRLQIVKP